MYKGGRPQNSIWEFFLHVAIGIKKYAKSVIISKLIMQVHYTKCSMDSVLSWYSAIGFSDAVLN